MTHQQRAKKKFDEYKADVKDFKRDCTRADYWKEIARVRIEMYYDLMNEHIVSLEEHKVTVLSFRKQVVDMFEERQAVSR